MSLKSSIKAHIDLFRASLGILSCLAVLVAGYIVYVLETDQTSIISFIFDNGVLEWPGLILGLTATMLLTFAIQAINDFYDVETDKANKRFDRPIARGALTRQYVLSITRILFTLAILIILFLVLFYQVTPFLLIFALLSVGIGWGYNYIKRTGFLGNMWVAMGYVAPLFIGFFLLKPEDEVSIQTSWLVLLTTFFLATGREIVKDIQDYEGDLQSNLNSLAVKLGPKKAGLIAALFFLLVLLTASAVGIFIYKNLVFWFFILILALILIMTIYAIMTEEPAIGGKKARKYTRWSLWWALSSFFFGVIYRL
ncbi:MAG: UbiA family prenyltransferase [Candidatus Hodarchaeales archaeon]